VSIKHVVSITFTCHYEIFTLIRGCVHFNQTSVRSVLPTNGPQTWTAAGNVAYKIRRLEVGQRANIS